MKHLMVNAVEKAVNMDKLVLYKNIYLMGTSKRARNQRNEIMIVFNMSYQQELKRITVSHHPYKCQYPLENVVFLFLCFCQRKPHSE